MRDTARVLGRYYDCAVWRTYRQRDLEEFAELSGIPVINGLTDYAHPCQVLADYLNLDRSALSKELCKMRDESLLTFEKNRFALHELPE